MDVAALVQDYGYLAVLVGTFLEGESILIAAGFAEQKDFLDLRLVIGIAIVASFLGDQLFFWIGHRYGESVLRRFPSLLPRAHRVEGFLARHQVPVILSIRFLYGLRVIGPVVMGMAPIRWQKFMLLNFIGAVVWAPLIATIGYMAGNAVDMLADNLQRYELGVVAALAMAAAAWWWWRGRKR